ncbi:transcription termination factor [Gottschalkia purinilytica]|uniref:Transcription termination factor n=1 Tax=Gottschalkia purinilytica TaxID=1503 RepID=A0A0L0W633_GOTPU|nr:Rho termination factor N-terminal domain-containing protein [Gottschalkia purinilytica]KNF06969.1 transcription termination factor [Gottschalkia purinilytica]
METKKVESSLNELTVDELKTMARDLGITGYSSMKKEELIKAIEEAQNQEGAI